MYRQKSGVIHSEDYSNYVWLGLGMKNVQNIDIMTILKFPHNTLLKIFKGTSDIGKCR